MFYLGISRPPLMTKVGISMPVSIRRQKDTLDLNGKNVFFVFRTLPLGWKASVFIYHNLGLVVSLAARAFGVPLSQYIDDRHAGQLFSSPMRSISPSAQSAQAAAYIVCYILIEAGYFINISKSQCVPSTIIRFLGFLCDSLRQSFLFPPDKKAKFRSPREGILSSSLVSLKTLQRFAGKAVPFSLAIPGCKLCVRKCLAP